MIILFMDAQTSEAQAFLRGENNLPLKLHFHLDDVLDAGSDNAVVLELDAEPEASIGRDHLLVHTRKQYLSLLDNLEHYYVL